jgi:hypothetical protein
MKRLLLAGALIALPILCMAATDPPLPDYDVAAFCKANPHLYEAGSPTLNEHSCIEAEYISRHFASDDWLKISPAARAECTRTAVVNQVGSYGLLWHCVNAHTNDSKVQ